MPRVDLGDMEHLVLPDGTERFTEDIRYDQFNDRRRRPQESPP